MFVHLVNYANGRYGRQPRPMPIEDIVPVYNVSVQLRARATRVTLVPQNEALAFTQHGAYVHFTVPEIDVHAVVAVSGALKSPSH